MTQQNRRPARKPFPEEGIYANHGRSPARMFSIHRSNTEWRRWYEAKGQYRGVTNPNGSMELQ